MQLVPQLPVHWVVADAEQWPVQAASNLSGVQLALQPPETSILQLMPELKSKVPQGPSSAASAVDSPSVMAHVRTKRNVMKRRRRMLIGISCRKAPAADGRQVKIMRPPGAS